MNQRIFEFAYSLTHHFVVLDWIFIFFAKYLVWFIIVFVLVKIFRKKDWGNDLPRWKNRFQYLSLGLIAAILSRGIITNIIENFVSSSRPFVALEIEPLFNHVASGSLPSGHMALLIPIALTMFFISRSAGWWALFLTLLVGVARVIAGVHWPSDILAGIIIGALSYYFVLTLFRKNKLI
ncbi:phosphatase PAP2 family protein [Patescibacteria group bacterium]|nr:phosphatase PAP2 family protein [Patescibacteria group bacterium]